ncbi:hypothetical protein [Methylobacterium thuringiense]|uniref:Uncharacterized protein n=1 Tax=Methylobacterium thuringiense TaxID=1003091 RepID=A0ABQ4TLF3_9HYPH|nr:hypothetical protein [Methylobacterium thuringiense]GJE54530.1 hypothetical protein EKPJFOCH_1008 [Methylobacterium thuringiense]
MSNKSFSDWIHELDVEVIQGEYGYEEGEFTVYPDHWKPLFREDLTPQQAFRRALDAFGEARRQEDADRKANWERIQAEDAAAIKLAREASHAE